VVEGLGGSGRSSTFSGTTRERPATLLVKLCSGASCHSSLRRGCRSAGGDSTPCGTVDAEDEVAGAEAGEPAA
jgi:hypothetical protein